MQRWTPENLVALDGSVSAWCGAGPPPTLDRILDATGQLSPGGHVGICAAARDAYKTLAGTDQLVFVLDDLQYALDEGPGITAVQEGHTVVVDDAEKEHRWPGFMAIAVALGLRSHVGVPIAVEGRTLGGLNLYSTTPGPLDAGRLAHAKRLAARAAVALGQAPEGGRPAAVAPVEQDHREAIGLLMEQLNLDDRSKRDGPASPNSAPAESAWAKGPCTLSTDPRD